MSPQASTACCSVSRVPALDRLVGDGGVGRGHLLVLGLVGIGQVRLIGTGALAARSAGTARASRISCSSRRTSPSSFP